MPIVLARIDERLIHGQIMSSPALSSCKVNHIIVIDALLKGNSAMQRIFNSSVQSGDCPIGEVSYLSAEELKDFMGENDSSKLRALLLFRDPGSALEAARGGCSIPALNLGNFTSKDPLKKSLTAAFSVGPEESAALNELYSIIGSLYFNGLNSRSSPYRPSRHSWDQR